jgi:hypothetical protein
VTAVELMRVRSVLSLGWHSGELLLNRSGTRENRWLILLAVFVAHGALVLLATRATRQMMSAPFSAADSLLLLLLPQAVPNGPNSLRRNHMVPMPPSFQWDHRRRDNGNPLGVIWIGQHCALVWLIPFCRIGHIEANGELLEHMRDPKEP